MLPTGNGQPADGSSAPPVIITGELVALGPIHKGLLSHLWTWESDLDLSVLTGDPARPTSQAAIEQLYETFSKASQDSTMFAVYERATMRPLGTAGLMAINFQHRTAELGIGIGEHEFWGKGYGGEATRLVLDYAFNVLTLHNVFLRVFSYNQRAIRAYLRVGFREIGRRRQAQRIGGKVYDVVHMDCLATEFDSPLLRARLPEGPAGEQEA